MKKRGAILSHAVLQKLVEYVSLSMRIGKKLDNEKVNCSLQVFSGSSPSVCHDDFGSQEHPFFPPSPFGTSGTLAKIGFSIYKARSVTMGSEVDFRNFTSTKQPQHL